MQKKHLIISGILKLGCIATAPRCNVEDTAVAYCGLGGLDLPPALSTPDEQGFCGAVQTAFLSLSDDKDVAAAFSGVGQGKAATILELELSKGSLGAEVAWLSQFPQDQERLLPPWTHLQVVGTPTRRTDGATVIRMRPTVFQNVRTVEEVAGARKEEIRAHIAGLVMDVRSQADSDDVDDSMSERPSEQTPSLHSLIKRVAYAHRLAAFEQDLLARFCKYEATWYDDNGKSMAPAAPHGKPRCCPAARSGRARADACRLACTTPPQLLAAWRGAHLPRMRQRATRHVRARQRRSLASGSHGRPQRSNTSIGAQTRRISRSGHLLKKGSPV